MPDQVNGLDVQLGQDAAQDRDNVLADVSPGRQDALTGQPVAGPVQGQDAAAGEFFHERERGCTG